MTWYPKAIVRATNKHGYGNDDSILGLGIVAHSMEGSLQAAFGELDRADRQASWHFSIAKDGTVYQHISALNISYASGSYEANRRFWSIEHEGRAGEPLEDAQRISTTGVMGWLLALKGLQPVRGESLREHNEMTAFGAAPTACPSNRIPWNEIISALEDDMPLTQEEKQWMERMVHDQVVAAVEGIRFRVGEGVKLNDVMFEVQATKQLVGGTIVATTDEIAKAVADEFAERQRE